MYEKNRYLYDRHDRVEDGRCYGYPGYRVVTSRIDGRKLILDTNGCVIDKVEPHRGDYGGWDIDLDGDDDGPAEYPGQNDEDIWTEQPFGEEYLLIG